MAIYHLAVKVCGRGRGIGGSDQSPVASSAYQSGEKLFNERDGLVKNYGRKERIVAQGLILAENFPQEWTREKLWNEVEKSEKNKNAQLYRKWEMALPKELSAEENINLAKKFIEKNFIENGMCADWAIHVDPENNNPHLHVMTTVRSMDADHNWQQKKRKEYILGANGKKQYDKKTKTYKCKTVSTTNWDRKDFLQQIRKAWADETNLALRKAWSVKYKNEKNPPPVPKITEKSYKTLAKKYKIYGHLKPTKHRGQSLKYDNKDILARNEKTIRTYMRDCWRLVASGRKFMQNPIAKIKASGFSNEKLKTMLREEQQNVAMEVKKLGVGGLRLEINSDLLNESEKIEIAYKNAGRDL